MNLFTALLFAGALGLYSLLTAPPQWVARLVWAIDKRRAGL